MKKQQMKFPKLSLKKDTIGALSARDKVLGGATATCGPVTQAPDLCQKSFIITGCPHPPQTQANCPSYPPQCSAGTPCNG